jgi:predicted dehydrogenase
VTVSLEGESLCRTLLRFESGVTASFDALLTEGAVAPRQLFTVTGSHRELTCGGSVWVRRFDGTDARGTKIGARGGYLTSYEGEWVDFCAAVLEGSPPAAPASDALGELRCALALYRSAASGRWEPVWD